MPMPTHFFSMEQQAEFAHLSGDFNPIHMNEDFARRTFYGSPLVHGVNVLLRGMELACSGMIPSFRLLALDARFVSPVYVNNSVRYEFSDDSVAGRCKIKGFVGKGTEVLAANFTYQATAPESCDGADGCEQAFTGRELCANLSMQEFEQATGVDRVVFDATAFCGLFPELFVRSRCLQMALILQTTRVVGMMSPGCNSLYSGCKFTFSPLASVTPVSCYKTVRFRDILSFGTVEILNGDNRAEADVFYRPSPAVQPTYEQLARRISPKYEGGGKALVVGGSRGIGEVCAKLLALRGVDVRLTYYREKEGAQAVCQQINAGGGKASCMQFDSTGGDEGGYADIADWAVGGFELYYFATPSIFGARVDSAGSVFNYELFCKFNEYYIKGLLNIVERFGGLLRGIFAPSTTAIDELPAKMGEYAVSKYAGELLGRIVGNACGIPVYTPRIPRVLTDQTASVVRAEAADVVEVLCRELGNFSAMRVGVKPS